MDWFMGLLTSNQEEGAVEDMSNLGKRKYEEENLYRSKKMYLMRQLHNKMIIDVKGLAQTIVEVKDANKRGCLYFAATEGILRWAILGGRFET